MSHNAWWITDLERLRREQNRRSEEQPTLQLPLPERDPRDRQERKEEEPQRGVVVIDYSV